MENIYTSGEYLKSNPDWHEGDSEWKATQIKKMMDHNHISPKTICEIGCGTGMVLSSLQQHMESNVTFSGYDISPQAIERARTRENENLHFFNEDATKHPNQFFDVILLIDLIEHLENYFDFLCTIKPMSTYKILHIPLDLSAQSIARINTILDRRKKVGHIHYFTKEIALQMLRDLGYEVIDSFFTGASIDLPSKSFKSMLARFPRKFFFKLCPDFSVRLLGGYSLMVLVK